MTKWIFFLWSQYNHKNNFIMGCNIKTYEQNLLFMNEQLSFSS